MRPKAPRLVPGDRHGAMRSARRAARRWACARTGRGAPAASSPKRPRRPASSHRNRAFASTNRASSNSSRSPIELSDPIVVTDRISHVERSGAHSSLESSASSTSNAARSNTKTSSSASLASSPSEGSTSCSRITSTGLGAAAARETSFGAALGTASGLTFAQRRAQRRFALAEGGWPRRRATRDQNWARDRPPFGASPRTASSSRWSSCKVHLGPVLPLARCSAPAGSTASMARVCVRARLRLRSVRDADRKSRGRVSSLYFFTKTCTHAHLVVVRLPAPPPPHPSHPLTPLAPSWASWRGASPCTCRRPPARPS